MIKPGCYTALATPMTDNGEIDWLAWQTLLDLQFKFMNGVVLFGSTAEAMSLSNDEMRQMLHIASQVRHKYPSRLCFAGISEAVTAKALAKIEWLTQSHVDGIMVVCPYYLRPTPAGVQHHFMTLADASTKPLILYNVPARTGAAIDIPSIIALSKHPNIVGLKDADSCLRRLQEIKSYVTDDFILLSGDDMSVCEYMQAGGHGLISVASNLLPEKWHDLCLAILQGTDSEDLWAELMPSAKACGIESNPAAVKWLLAKKEYGTGFCRSPLLPLSERGQREIDQLISIATA